MQSYISMTVTQDQIEKEKQRKIAVIQSGYAFVVLQLIDLNKKRVSAMDTLVTKPTEKIGVHIFEIVSRQLMFEPDLNRGNVYTAYVLDTEWNRKFIASHYDNNYWEIVDVIPGRKGVPLVYDTFVKEIIELRDELKANTITSTSGMGIPVLVPQDNNKNFDVASLDDEILENELKRRQNLNKKDIGAMVQKKETIVEKKDVPLDPNMSDEEFKSLSKGKRSYVTKLRKNLTLNEQNNKEDIKEEIVMPESHLLNSPLGVQQP